MHCHTIKLRTKLSDPCLVHSSAWTKNWPQLLITACGASSTNNSVHVPLWLCCWQTAKSLCCNLNFMFFYSLCNVGQLLFRVNWFSISFLPYAFLVLARSCSWVPLSKTAVFDLLNIYNHCLLFQHILKGILIKCVCVYFVLFFSFFYVLSSPFVVLPSFCYFV